jgi:hypothetical protein
MDIQIKKIFVKSYLIVFIALAFLLTFGGNVHARFMKKLTVEPFSDPANWGKSFKPGIFFSSMLEDNLAGLGIFQMVQLKKIEPNIVKKLKNNKEQKPGDSNKENEKEETKKDIQAKMISLTSSKSMPLSQYKIRGDILIFDPDTNPLKKSHTAKEAKFHQERAFIQANIELVNLHTGRLLAKKIFTASSGTGRKIFNLNLTEDTDYRSDKFKSHSIGRALWQLNDQVQMFIYKTLNAVPLEGDLILVDHKNNSAIINLGKANGVKVRDVFTVFSVEPSFNDPVVKVDLGDRYSRKGIIKVSEVQGRFSKAQILAGVDFVPGDLVVPKNSNPKNSNPKKLLEPKIPWTKRYPHKDKKENLLQGDVIWGDYKGLPSLSY